MSKSIDNRQLAIGNQLWVAFEMPGSAVEIERRLPDLVTAATLLAEAGGPGVIFSVWFPPSHMEEWGPKIVTELATLHCFGWPGVASNFVSLGVKLAASKDDPAAKDFLHLATWNRMAAAMMGVGRECGEQLHSWTVDTETAGKTTIRGENPPAVLSQRSLTHRMSAINHGTERPWVTPGRRTWLPRPVLLYPSIFTTPKTVASREAQEKFCRQWAYRLHSPCLAGHLFDNGPKTHLERRRQDDLAALLRAARCARVGPDKSDTDAKIVQFFYFMEDGKHWQSGQFGEAMEQLKSERPMDDLLLFPGSQGFGGTNPGWRSWTEFAETMGPEISKWRATEPRSHEATKG